MSDAATRARAVWTRLGVHGRWGAAALVCAVLVAGVSAGGFLRALAASGAGGKTEAESSKEQIERYNKSFGGYVSQIDGRSMFFVPGPPRRSSPPTTESSEPKPPPAPTRYEGPALIGLASDAVFFNDGKTVRVGEQSGSVKVKSIDPPWSATLVWEGSEFVVGLFDRDRVILPSEKKGETPAEKPVSSISESKPPEAKPGEGRAPEGVKPGETVRPPETGKPVETKPADPRAGGASGVEKPETILTTAPSEATTKTEPAPSGAEKST